MSRQCRTKEGEGKYVGCTHPIPVYRQVHTTGKAAFGGRHDGFCRVGYQVFTSLRVIKPPRNPPTWGRVVIPSTVHMFWSRAFTVRRGKYQREVLETRFNSIECTIVGVLVPPIHEDYHSSFNKVTPTDYCIAGKLRWDWMTTKKRKVSFYCNHI